MQQGPSSGTLFYDLMPSFIKQQNYCRVLAINNDNSILLTGCQSIINIHQIKQGTMKQVKRLVKHNKLVTTLNFFNEGNFFSGSDDGKIIIWQKCLISKTKYLQQLNNHYKSILCVILNNQENLIVSGSYDTTIKFWGLPFKNLKQWSCMQTLAVHTQPVYGLSMNEEQNKLVSCGYDSSLFIIEFKESELTWIIKQKIQVDQWGYRVCFINNNIFTFQPLLGTHLQIFQLNQTSQIYINSQNLKVNNGGIFCSSLFPSTFNNKKSIIVNKNGSHLNLIRFTKNKNNLGNEEYVLTLEQSINFGTDQFGIAHVYGTMSKDGNFLISWDGRTQKIQIRFLQEL